MKHRRIVACVVMVCVGLLSCDALFAEGADDEHGGPPPDPAGFAKLKALAGQWEGTADHGEQVTPVVVSYRVTAGGSTVIETTFEGTEHEMATVYRMDGDRLLLTHYCMANNQPTMASDDADNPQRLHFKCTEDGYRGMASESVGHMHDVVFQFLDDDQFQAEWTMYEDGEPGHTAKLDVKRVAE